MRPVNVEWSTTEMVALEFSPKQMLYKKIVRGILVILLITAALICLISAASYGPWRTVSRDERGATMTRLVALSLDNTEGAAAIETHELWQNLARQRELRFMAVVDGNGDVIAHNAKDEEAWKAFATQSLTPASDAKPHTKAIPWRSLVVHVVPIGGSSMGNTQRQLIVGLDDAPSVAAMSGTVVSTGAGVLLVMLCVLPIFSGLVRRHTRSMADLLQAIRRIAEGGRPKALAVRDNGEMGYLSAAFNEMASRLAASRQDLVDANAHLEQRVKQRTRELADAAKKLEEMATTDALTGLPNVRAWHENVADRFDAAEREERDVICVAVDLDGFKGVNDTLGHQTGDRVLVAASEAIKANIRQNDFSARLGGDEFVMLLESGNPDVATTIAERIQEKFQAACRDIIGDTPLDAPPSMSFGLAMRLATRAKTAEQLHGFADQALYDAKGAGKSCARFHASSANAA